MAEFIRIPDNPAPAGAEVFDFPGADYARLRGAIFPCTDSRGCVVIACGWAEFIEKYFEIVRDLHARGLSAAAMDWFAQGRSERGRVSDFSVYRNDLRRFTDDVARRRLGGPHVLLAHSMGGLVGLDLLAEGYDGFSAAVLTSPMTRLVASPVRRATMTLAAHAARFVGASGMAVPGARFPQDFEASPFTADPGRHRRFRELQAAAPDAVVDAPNFSWLRAADIAMSAAARENRFECLETPVLIVSAGADRVVDSNDHLRIAAQSPLIERIEIAGARHEILMERDEVRARFWKAFDAFVEPRLAAAQASTSSSSAAL